MMERDLDDISLERSIIKTKTGCNREDWIMDDKDIVSTVYRKSSHSFSVFVLQVNGSTFLCRLQP